MQVFVTGATGFVGRALVQRLLGMGHGVTAWVRDPKRARNQLGPEVTLCPTGDDEALVAALSRSRAVVNLAGESVLKGRWSRARREALWSSRVELTRTLVDALERVSPRPRVLLCASAVGYYGDCGDAALDEGSPRGQGFLALLCDAWEAAAQDAEGLGMRVARLRIGIVLGHDGGMLAATVPMFRLGLGGPVGPGTQYQPWIHIDDLVELVVRGLTDEAIEGPINATAPWPVTSRELAQELGHRLGRPARMPAPAPLLKLVLGARAQVVLQSQRALPKRLQQLGFRFEHPTLAAALGSIVDTVRTIELRRVSATDRDAPEGATYVLESRTRLDVPAETAFEFFCRAENLALITPSWLSFEILGGPPSIIVEGTEIRYRIRLGPISVNWKTVIRHWDPPRAFVDNQDMGPYRLWWHEHRIEPTADGSRMVDRVYYTPPLGVLGRIANPLWIAASLRHIFAYRADAIGRLFERSPAPSAGA